MHLRALMALLGEERRNHVLFGTDFPNAPTKTIEYMTAQLDGQDTIDVQALGGLEMFPRLKR